MGQNSFSRRAVEDSVDIEMDMLKSKFEILESLESSRLWGV